MQIITKEQEQFYLAYIAKQFKIEFKSNSVEFVLWIKNMDTTAFKRMLNSYAAQKKRAKAKAEGKEKISIELDKEAHEFISKLAKENNMTLSEVILNLKNEKPQSSDEKHFEKLFISQNEDLKKVTNLWHIEKQKTEKLKAEIEQLKEKETITQSEVIELENKNTITKTVQPIQKVIKISHRCCATTTKGTRCKNTENLVCINENDGSVLCKFHQNIWVQNGHNRKNKTFEKLNYFAEKDAQNTI